MQNNIIVDDNQDICHHGFIGNASGELHNLATEYNIRPMFVVDHIMA